MLQADCAIAASLAVSNIFFGSDKPEVVLALLQVPLLLLQMNDDVFRLLAAACLAIICRHAAARKQCKRVMDADMEAATGFSVRKRSLLTFQATMAVRAWRSSAAVFLAPAQGVSAALAQIWTIVCDNCTRHSSSQHPSSGVTLSGGQCYVTLITSPHSVCVGNLALTPQAQMLRHWRA